MAAKKIYKRRYQIETAEKVWADKKHRRTLVVSPGGSGKTIIIAYVVRLIRQHGLRVLIVTHRREIIHQIRRVLKSLGEVPALIMGADTTDEVLPVTIASINSIASRGTPDADVLIIDEAHRSMAKTYQNLIAYFIKKNRRIIGFSATPYRLDGVSLKPTFQDMVEAAKPSVLLKNRHIVRPDMWIGDPKFMPDLADLKVTRGRYEYTQQSLASYVRKTGLLGNVVKHVKKHVRNGVQAILFGVSIAHSLDICGRLKRAGIKACHVDGKMPAHVRDEIVSAFERGEFQVLCNCDLLSEGWDMPSCDGVIMCCPTQSLTRYLQQAARCMRPNRGKRPFIIDLSWNIQHDVPWADREWPFVEGKAPKPVVSNSPVRICPKCHYINPPGTEFCQGKDENGNTCGYDLRTRRVLLPGEKDIFKMKKVTAARIKEIRAWAKKNGKSATWVKKVIAQEKKWLSTP